MKKISKNLIKLSILSLILVFSFGLNLDKESKLLASSNFNVSEIDLEVYEAGIGADNKKLKSNWDNIVNDTLEKAKLVRPKDSYMASGSKKGIHTEHLGFILAEMQFLQRAYPDAKW